MPDENYFSATCTLVVATWAGGIAMMAAGDDGRTRITIPRFIVCPSCAHKTSFIL